MQKKWLPILLTVAILVSLAPQLVLANAEQEATAKTTRTEIRKGYTEQRMEQKTEMITTIADRVEQRFARHQERLQSWLERAEQRIAKMKANGKDVTAAEAALVTARASLANAVNLGDTAVAKLRAITPEGWKNQDGTAKSAREAVRTAQVAYAQVVKDFSKAVQSMKGEK